MKKGQNYKFLRDYVDTTGAILFKKGKIYTAISDINLVDEYGNIHYFTNQEGNLFVQYNPSDAVLNVDVNTSNTEEINDEVNHPSHYCTGNVECIDAMISAYGIETVKNFCICNAFKYLWRFKYKNKDIDIEKMLWYINKFKSLNAKRK